MKIVKKRKSPSFETKSEPKKTGKQRGKERGSASTRTRSAPEAARKQQLSALESGVLHRFSTAVLSVTASLEAVSSRLQLTSDSFQR